MLCVCVCVCVCVYNNSAAFWQITRTSAHLQQSLSSQHVHIYIYIYPSSLRARTLAPRLFNAAQGQPGQEPRSECDTELTAGMFAFHSQSIISERRRPPRRIRGSHTQLWSLGESRSSLKHVLKGITRMKISQRSKTLCYS